MQVWTLREFGAQGDRDFRAPGVQSFGTLGCLGKIEHKRKMVEG